MRTLVIFLAAFCAAVVGTTAQAGESLPELRKKAEASSGDYDAWIAWQDTALAAGQRAKVETEAEARMSADPSPLNRVLRARLLSGKERSDALTKIVGDVPEYLPAHLELVDSELRRGRTRQAERAAKVAFAIGETDARAHLVMARAAVATGKGKNAEKYFKSGLGLDAKRGAMRVAFARYLESDDRVPEALVLLEAGLEANEDPLVRLGLGELQIRIGEYAGASSNFTKVMGHDRWRPQALTGRGWARFRKGDYEPALGDFQSAVRLLPDLYEAHYRLGATYLKVKDGKEKGLESLAKAIKIDPTRPEAISLRGYVHWTEHNLDLALVDQKKALEADAKYIPALIRQAQIWAQQGELSDARKAYQKILKMAPKNYDALTNVAMVEKNLGKTGDALKAIEKALAISETAFALTLKGEILRAMKKYDRSIEALNLALEVDEKYQPAWRTLGHSFEEADKSDEAIDAYGRAVELKPDDSFARYLYAYLLYDLAMDEDALVHFTAYIDLVGEDRDVQAIIKILEGG